MTDFATPAFTTFFCALFVLVSFFYYRMMAKGMTGYITLVYLFSTFLLGEIMFSCKNFLLRERIYVEFGHANLGLILLSASWLAISIIIIIISFSTTKR